jgi:HK97 family phage major capsid protein
MPVSGAAVTFMLESTFTNNAAAKAEGDGAVESALALTETSKTVREVATFVPTSRVQLEDVAFAEAYLNNRLTLMVRQKLESQCLEGDGNAPNLEGTLNLGAIQTQALGADSRADAIYKAFDLIRTVGYAEPSVLFINPADWQPIRLSQTADGVYLFGNPADGDMNRIWGVPVVQTMAVTANTALTGDYANFAFLGIRRGVEVEMSSGYSDYFVKGKLAVLASLRAAMVHTRETAFCKLTGF